MQTSSPRGPSGIAIAFGVVLAMQIVLACGFSLNSFCKPDPGEIVFGNERSSDIAALDACLKSFKQEGDFAFVGAFSREVTGAVSMQVVKGSDPPRRAGSDYVFDAPGNFWSGLWHLSDFPGPGHYVISMVQGTEVLATGEFDLTP